MLTLHCLAMQVNRRLFGDFTVFHFDVYTLTSCLYCKRYK
jgi:hypothetical protein